MTDLLPGLSLRSNLSWARFRASFTSIFSWVVPVHAEHRPDDDELSATLTLVIIVIPFQLALAMAINAGLIWHAGRNEVKLLAIAWPNQIR